MKIPQVFGIYLAAAAASSPLAFGQNSNNEAVSRSAQSSLPIGSGSSQASDSSSVTTTTSDGSSIGQVRSSHNSSCIRASKLIGSSVAGKDGTNLGQVQDLVIDPRTGKIQFALVGQGFMAGAGETTFPIPWRAVNVKTDQQFVLNVDQQKLKTAPAWSETQIEHPDYVSRVFRFYDLEPQAEMGGPGQSLEQSGQGKSSSSVTGEKSEGTKHSEQSTAPDK